MPLNTAETELCPACANLPELEEGLAPTFTIFNREWSHDCLCEYDSAPPHLGTQKESFPLGTVVFRDTSLWSFPQGLLRPVSSCSELTKSLSTLPG